jgi:hypothetical protein
VIGPEPDSLAYNLILIIPACLSGLAVFIVKSLHDDVLSQNRKRIAALPMEAAGFKALGDWFSRSFGITSQVVFSVLTGVLADLTVRTLTNSYEILNTNLGLYIGVFGGMFAIGNGGYCALVIPTLTSKASRHRMRLFPYDPASTTALRVAGAGFGQLALANGLVATLVIALIATFRPWSNSTTFQIALGWLLIGWGFAIYSFIFPNFHISRIIIREKRFEIEGLEAVVAPLHSQFARLSKPRLEQLQTVVELRDRLFKASNSLIDIAGWRDFVGSLLLPLMSFLIGFVDVRGFLRTLF